MRITQVTINFTETCNLGDYSNTKPSIEIQALLEAGDDVHAVIDELVTTAQAVIHEKIDAELERVDKPVKYSTDPLYDVIYSSRTNLVAIVPAGPAQQFDGGYYPAALGIRYAAAFRRANQQLKQMNSSTVLFDCNGVAPTLDSLAAYATEKRQLEDAKREREQAEWLAEQAALPAIKEDEEEVDDFDVDDDDEESDEG